MVWFWKKGLSSGLKRIYMDYASATPMRPEVQAVMEPFFVREFGNPSAIHREGRVVRDAIEDSRKRLAAALHVRARDILFTSGGTESNNLAIRGVIEARRARGVAYADMEIITTAIEHPSVLEVMDVLRALGVVVHYAPVDGEGLIDLKVFETLLSPKTVLVTFAYANSEIGVVQPVKKITRMIRLKNFENVVVHVDGSQAPLWLPCQMDSLGVDLVTLDAGKCYGPKGMGVLVMRGDVQLVSHVVGGDQERGLRAGTENVPAIIGGVEAILIALKNREVRSARALQIREYFFDALLKVFPSMVINGSRSERIANNVNVSIPSFDGEYAVVWLDTNGVSASTRSACSGMETGGSHVIREIVGTTEGASDRIRSAIRFTIGEETRMDEIDLVIEILKAFSRTMQKLDSQ